MSWSFPPDYTLDFTLYITLDTASRRFPAAASAAATSFPVARGRPPVAARVQDCRNDDKRGPQAEYDGRRKVKGRDEPRYQRREHNGKRRGEAFDDVVSVLHHQRHEHAAQGDLQYHKAGNPGVSLEEALAHHRIPIKDGHRADAQDERDEAELHRA